MALTILALISGISFLKYGLDILCRERLRLEFERYDLTRFQKLVGSAEVAGGLAVLVGLQIATLGVLGSAGLAVLMGLGLIVRIRLRDPIRLLLPAATLAVINAALVVLFASS